MDLTHPLAAVLPELSARVLVALLATTGRSTGAQVQRIAGAGSENGVRAILANLVRQGLVTAEPAGRATLYTLNRDHVLCDALTAMSRARSEILQRITDEVESWSSGAPAWHASVFGSFARAEAGVASDIDVLVVAAPETDVTDLVWTEQTVRLARRITAWTGNRADVMTADVASLHSLLLADDPLIASWRAESVHVAGTPLIQVLREVRARTGLMPASERGAR